MLVDFMKIATLIPEKGSIAMVFTRGAKKGEITVSYVVKHEKDGKEKDSNKAAVNPITFTDTPENFNADFEATVVELTTMGKELVSIPEPKTVKTVAATKKVELQKAIDKKKGPQTSAETKDAKDAKKDDSQPNTLSLFDTPPSGAQAALKPGEANAAAEQEGAGTGEPEEGAAEEDVETEEAAAGVAEQAAA